MARSSASCVPIWRRLQGLCPQTAGFPIQPGKPFPTGLGVDEQRVGSPESIRSSAARRSEAAIGGLR